MKTLPYNNLPDFNNLFLDYIDDFDKIKNYYKYDYRDDNEFLNALIKKKNTYLKETDFSREDLCRILVTQNKFFNSSEKTYEKIEQLKSSNTFAIVTGQQVGMLTGPIYTILKAINAIQLANKLNQKFKDYNFVPVFWLECEDHDFLEVNNVNVLTKENEVRNVSYFGEEGEQEKYLKPAGTIILDDKIEELKSQIRSDLNETDFSNTVFDYINRSYKAGIDLKTAFARLLNYYLKDEGLIFIDPSEKDLKRPLISIFKKELASYPALCEKVIFSSAEMEHEYDPVIKPKPINLFYTHNGNRYLIEPKDGESYGLKNSRQKFSRDEMFLILNANPELFSPNVLLRPVCQDTILPTIAYIGGPSEISYFAQVKDAYEFFETPMPLVYPRTSVTIVEKRVETFLEKNKLKILDLFHPKDTARRMVEKFSEVNIEELFSQYLDEVNSVFYQLKQKLEAIDKNLVNTLEKKDQQYKDSLNILKDKFMSSYLNQNEIVTKQLNKILSVIFPEHSLQERSINIVYFLNKYGMDFIQHLKDNIDIERFEHQFIETNFEAAPLNQETEKQNS
ncbi:MAG: bacillithiol biosynthesis cysteine-adding enzyme BshC [Ignavibacteria bacterium]|nr:bacillithiol biosynthesis cysteine-adding enzyme BshC [Ignavibacteria bacterium]